MTTSRKILTMLALLFLLIISFCYIGFHLGYDGLLLIGELTLPSWIEEFIAFFLFSAQYILMACVILKIYDSRIFSIVLPYVVAKQLIQILVPFIFPIPIQDYMYFFLTGVFPYLYLLIYAVFYKDFKKSFLRTLVIYGTVAIYQVVAQFIKLGRFVTDSYYVSEYEWLMFSIDLCILILVCFAIGGERYYEEKNRNPGNPGRSVPDRIGSGSHGNSARWKRYLYPEEVESVQRDHEDCVAEKAWSKLQGFKKAKAMSLLLGFQLLQWSLILMVCSLSNVLIEGIVITTSFIAHGFIIQRRWHSKSLVICTLTSICMFYISAKVTISFQYSQFFPIIVGLALLYTLYRVAIYVDNSTITQLRLTAERLKAVEQQLEQAQAIIAEISDIL